MLTCVVVVRIIQEFVSFRDLTDSEWVWVIPGQETVLTVSQCRPHCMLPGNIKWSTN